jgi:uncharacterized protein YcfJ
MGGNIRQNSVTLPFGGGYSGHETDPFFVGHDHYVVTKPGIELIFNSSDSECGVRFKYQYQIDGGSDIGHIATGWVIVTII